MLTYINCKGCVFFSDVDSFREATNVDDKDQLSIYRNINLTDGNTI